MFTAYLQMVERQIKEIEPISKAEEFLGKVDVKLRFLQELIRMQEGLKNE